MPRSLLTPLALAAFLGVLGGASSARAASLDVRGWLERPGVKLLAVEFYATWCKPCMEAVPRWRELHERYRKDGLRLVVVATQDPEGGCVNPGWNPDEVICDDDGRLARMFGAGDSLPAAFLWSWQGNLLVRRGHVDEVEKSIAEWIPASPRVDVQVAGFEKDAGVTETELRDLVRAELGRSAKLTVVASEEERRRLAEVKKRALDMRFDEKSRCDLGKELSPNSLLEVSIVGRPDRRRLRLGLLSVERGCLVGSALVDWNRNMPTVSVAEAGSELFQKLRPQIQMPRGRAVSFGGRRRTRGGLEEDIGERFEAWEPDVARERVIVEFGSKPPGAVVLLDGELLCQDTSRGCRRDVPKGVHEVTMQRERYEKRTEQVMVAEGVRLEWTLEPSFGTYSVRSSPAGLALKVDGEQVGKTPVDDLELDPGQRELLVSDPCYFDRGKRLLVKPGEARTLDFEMQARMGALDVVAVDPAGNAMRGELWVDGARVGDLPGVFKLPVCAKSLEIRRDGRVVYETAPEVKERALGHLRAIVGGGETTPEPEAEAPRALGAAVYTSPAHVDFESKGAKSEGRALLAAVRASLDDVTTFDELRGLERAVDGRGALVFPELEKGSPKLDRAARRALKSFVEKGGVLVTLLDDPRRERGPKLLRQAFGFRLRTKASAAGDRSKRTAEAQKLGFGVRALPHNNDSDVLDRASLPRAAIPLYVDDGGDALVTLIPVGAGYVGVLGWDWFGGAPLGESDGGWSRVLRALLALSSRSTERSSSALARSAPPEARPPETRPPDARGREAGGFLLYSHPDAVDYDPSNPKSEGVGLEKALETVGARVSGVRTLEGGGLSRALEGRSALVIPDLEKGAPRFDGSGVRVLRSFVRKGGTLVTVLDESGKDRAAALLREYFGWRLRVNASPVGKTFPRTARGAAILPGAPATLPANNDTDALDRRSLPREAETLYADDEGNAVVARIPEGSGEVLILGWDWYDGAPRGAQDGGWLALLEKVVRRASQGAPQESPKPAPSSTRAAPASGGGRPVAFVNDPRFVDMGPGGDGSALRDALRDRGLELDLYYLGAFGDIYRKQDELQAALLPPLIAGTDERLLLRQLKGSAKGLRAYVARGGTLVVFSGGALGRLLDWSFRFRYPSTSAQSGLARLDASAASSLGLEGLPPSLPPVVGATAFDGARLPRGALALYPDSNGRSSVIAVPYRRGRFVLVGFPESQLRSTEGRASPWLDLMQSLLR